LARGPSTAALESSAAARTDLENCHLGKYPWKLAALENGVGKIPKIPTLECP